MPRNTKKLKKLEKQMKIYFLLNLEMLLSIRDTLSEVKLLLTWIKKEMREKFIQKTSKISEQFDYLRQHIYEYKDKLVQKSQQ